MFISYRVVSKSLHFHMANTIYHLEEPIKSQHSYRTNQWRGIHFHMYMQSFREVIKQSQWLKCGTYLAWLCWFCHAEVNFTCGVTSVTSCAGVLLTYIQDSLCNGRNSTVYNHSGTHTHHNWIPLSFSITNLYKDRDSSLLAHDYDIIITTYLGMELLNSGFCFIEHSIWGRAIHIATKLILRPVQVQSAPELLTTQQLQIVQFLVCIINRTLLTTIRAVIGTLTCTSMASNSTSDSECY